MRTRKIDWYIVGTFVGPFGLSLGTFIGLFVVADFFSNIDEFLSHESLFATLAVTVRYYGLVIPSYLSQIMPFLVVVPAVVCMLRLQGANEICAMRSSGISGRSISVPVIVCSLVVMVGAAINQEVVVPALHVPLLAAERGARGSDPKRVEAAYAVDRVGRFLVVGSYDSAVPLPTLTGVGISWDDESGGHHEIRADRAFALVPGSRWYMEGVRESGGGSTGEEERRWFESAAVGELVQKYRESADRGAVPLIATDRAPFPVAYEFGSYTEKDEVWPVARNVEIIHPSQPGRGGLRATRMVWTGNGWRLFGAWQFWGIDPDTKRLREKQLPEGTVLTDSIRPWDIKGREFKQASESMTLGELADAAYAFPSHRFAQRCWVVIWNRVATPLGNVILVLMALPLVFRHTRRDALFGVAAALVLTLLYVAANFISIDLANRRWFLWDWPFFAGVFPTVLFAGLAVWLFAKIDEV